MHPDCATDIVSFIHVSVLSPQLVFVHFDCKIYFLLHVVLTLLDNMSHFVFTFAMKAGGCA